MKLKLAFLILSSNVLVAQNSEEIWGIGTKWTYEFQFNPNEYGYITNEIIDTTTIDSLKLYEVETSPSTAFSGIQYFHYKNSKVYNYDSNKKILQLLYDFENEDGYYFDYQPVCDLFFPYDSLNSREYHAIINNISEYQMPDGSIRNLQNASVTDTVTEVDGSQILVTMNRQILSGIGFTRGFLHHSHDWELGLYMCDEYGNFISDLRCFENDSIFYNFKDYACDSTWILTATEELDKEFKLNLFPNPTSGKVRIDNFRKPVKFKIFDLSGNMVQTGLCENGEIDLKSKGINIIKIQNNMSWKTFKIVNLSNSR